MNTPANELSRCTRRRARALFTYRGLLAPARVSAGVMLPGMDRCLKCNSDRIARGKIKATDGLPVFSPEGRGFLSRFLFFPGTMFTGEAFACLDCGLVWGSTSPEEVREFIQKHCDQKPNKPTE